MPNPETLTMQAAARRSSADSAHYDELEETRKLVKSLNRFLHGYRQIHAGTGFAELVNKAADRAEESLVECMRRATDELVLPPPLV